VAVPDYLPDTPDVRQDLAEFYGAITVADAAVGRLLDTLEETGLDRTTWVLFMTDHGPALPRAKSTLYDAGTGIAMILRPPRDEKVFPRVYDELFSGVDLVPTLLELLGVDVPTDIDGISHADNLRHTHTGPARTEVYTMKTYHDSFDPIRAVRNKDYSYIENYASRPLLDLPWDIAESAPGQTVAPLVQAPRPERELYDLNEDPSESRNLLGPEASDKAEAIANDLALLLNEWRQKTNDVIPSDFAGTRIAERYTETYLRIHGPSLTSRAAIASERGIADEHISGQ
jgi:arylsulfatase A-like enzyme